MNEVNTFSLTTLIDYLSIKNHKEKMFGYLATRKFVCLSVCLRLSFFKNIIGHTEYALL